MHSTSFMLLVTVVVLLACLSVEVWSSEVTVGGNNWYNNNKPVIQQSMQSANKLRQQINNNEQQQQQQQGPSLFSDKSPVRCELDIKSCVPLLIQQHVDESTTVFNRTWNDYKRGFNDSRGNYWIGNELLHQLTKNGRYKLRFDLQSHATQGWFWAEYKPFVVFDESTQYESLAGVYTGNAGFDAFRHSSERKFSAYDRDNDISGSNCAAVNVGGFWYGGCANSCVNSIHGKHNGFYWANLPGGGRLMTSRMWLLCR